MRVIAGSARGRKLLAPRGLDTRPTTDRLKETLFNILAPGLQGVSFLDLFSGSGAIGIEALSRGAAYSVFIEKQKCAVDVINKNLQATGFSGKALVVHRDYIGGLHTLKEKGYRFDMVFMDAPYGLNLTQPAISYIAEQGLLAGGGRIIAEIAAGEEEPMVSGFMITRTKKCTTTSFVFLEAEP